MAVTTVANPLAGATPAIEDATAARAAAMARRTGAVAPALPAAPANDSLGPAYQAHVQTRQVSGDADAARAAAMARRSAAATPGATAGTPAPAASAKPPEPPAPGRPEATAAAAAEEPGFLHRLGQNIAHPIAAMEASVPLGAAALAAGGKDVLEGATVGAIPAVLGGARDATQHTLELIKGTGDWLDANVAHLPLPQSLQGAAEMPAQLPGAGTLTGTTTEGVLRTGAEYLAGFAMGGKVMDAVKAGEIAGPAVANVGKGIVADFAAMDPKGERLTNLWGKLGLPANVVTDWLAAKPGDSEIEGRFKNALEGAGLGALAGGIGQAADAWKAAREAAAGGPGAVVDAATSGAPKVSLEELKAKLGDPESQLMVRRTAAAPTLEEATAAKAAQAQAATAPAYTIDFMQNLLDKARGKAASGGATQTADLGAVVPRRPGAAPAEPPSAALHGLLEDAIADGRVKLEGEPIEPAEIERMAADMQSAIRDVRYPTRVKSPPTLLTFLQRSGGVVDDSGELRDMGVKRPGLIVRSGRTLDEAASEAAQAGYLPKSADMTGTDAPRAQLLAAIESDHRGSPVYAEEHAGQVERLQAARDLEEQLSRLGIDPRKASDEEVAAALLKEQRPPFTAERSQGDIQAERAAEDAAGLYTEKPGASPSGFYVNWAKVDAPEDVQRVMGHMADHFAGDLDAARRGEVSFEAQKLGARAEDAWNVLVSRREGQPLNAEQSLAARGLWASSGAKLSELAQAAADSPSDANLFAFQKQLATHHMVQREVIAARTETARALGSWKIPVGGDEERARQIDWLLANQGGQETTKALAQRMAILARQGDVAGLDGMADKAASLTTMDAVRSVWVNMLLSSPATHLANMGDNLLMAAQQVWERYGAEKISAALGQADGVAHGEALAQVYGMVSGWKDALRYAAKASMTGESGFGIGKIEEARPFALGQRANVGGDYAASGDFGRAVDYLGQMLRRPKVALGEVLNSPGTALVAEDEFFKTIGYRAEVHAQSLRQATQEARSGAIANEPEAIGRRMAELVRDPPENIRMAAVDAAMYATLNNAPGNLGRGLIGLRNALTVKGIPIGHFLMPFARVPANSMSYMLARTPLAYLMSTFKADIEAGGPRQALALSRLAFGSMTMMAAADLAMGGLITGSGPKDTVGRAALPRDWQPYSVKGPGGRYYGFNRLGALGSQLGIAADLVDYFRNTDWNRHGTEPVMPMWAAATLMTAHNALSKTFVQGIAQLNDALADPQRYGPRFFEGLAGSVVPGIVATTARGMDPHAKDVRGMLDAVMARTPGLSDKVPNRLDLWGRPITYQSGLGGAYDMLSPVRATSGKTDEPIDKEIARQGIAPTLPQRVVSFAAGAPPTDLEHFPGAYQRYQALAGNDAKHPEWGGLGAKDYLNAVVGGKHPMSPVYQLGTDGPDGGKATFIKDVIARARAQALVMLRQERADVRVAVSRQMTTPKVQGVPAMPAVPMLSQ